jgi:predicted dehydrogenase
MRNTQMGGAAMKKIKIGQIGIGHNHGGPKMLAARRLPELFEVVGYSEENPAWVEKRGNDEAYRGLTRYSTEELISRCDALLIETDVWDLTATAQKCVDAGKHIHMDKPASGTLAEFERLLSAAKEKDLCVQMGYMYRYNPAVQWCIEKARSGALGEIYSINAEMSTYHNVAFKKWLTNFKGGTMYIFGSHLIDLIVYLLGEPKQVTSFLKKTQLDGVDLEDNCLSVLEYDKALARVFVSSVEVNGWGRRQFVVTGSKGSVSVLPLENRLAMTYSDLSIAGEECYQDKKIEIPMEDINNSCRYDSMMRDFYDYVTKKKQNPFTYKHDYLVQKVLDEIIDGVDFHSHQLPTF